MATKNLGAVVVNRIVDLDEKIYQGKQYGNGVFRVDMIVERYSVTTEGHSSYSVEVFGAMQTLTGKDHSRNRGAYMWVDGNGILPATLDQIPAEIRNYLAGKDGLAGVVLI